MLWSPGAACSNTNSAENALIQKYCLFCDFFLGLNFGELAHQECQEGFVYVYEISSVSDQTDSGGVMLCLLRDLPVSHVHRKSLKNAL